MNNIDFTEFNSLVSVIRHFRNEHYCVKRTDEQLFRWNTREAVLRAASV